jgi:hypothetical protein
MDKDVRGRAFVRLCLCVSVRFGFAGWEIYDLCLFCVCVCVCAQQCVRVYVSWSAVYATAYRRRRRSLEELSGEVAAKTGCGGASFMGFWLCGPLLCLPMGRGYPAVPRYGCTGRRWKVASGFTVRGGCIDIYKYCCEL